MEITVGKKTVETVSSYAETRERLNFVSIVEDGQKGCSIHLLWCCTAAFDVFRGDAISRRGKPSAICSKRSFEYS